MTKACTRVWEKTGANPRDRGKRSVLTEGHGVPVSVVIARANQHDMKLVRQAIESLVVERPEPTENRPQGMCLDKGYDYDEVRSNVTEFGFTAHIRARSEETQAIRHEAGFKARSFVVERAHSWTLRFRRLLMRWDKKPDHDLGFLHFACGLITFRSAGLFGEAPHSGSRE
jgi:putative transposase